MKSLAEYIKESLNKKDKEKFKSDILEILDKLKSECKSENDWNKQLKDYLKNFSEVLFWDVYKILRYEYNWDMTEPDIHDEFYVRFRQIIKEISKK